MWQAYKARETKDDHLVNAKNDALCQSASEVRGPQSLKCVGLYYYYLFIYLLLLNRRTNEDE